MKEIKDLDHKTTEISGGGHVIILDTGAVINQEAEAMLQALHSRSIGGLMSHLETLEKRGADNFMKNFYVGYGHKSIGDCGTITIFIEGVSMLTAKAIQDWALYSGQEASTRYIDFKTQPFKNPAGTSEANQILENYRNFYIESLDLVNEHLKKQFPISEGEPEEKYSKAINAAVFDRLRGFLPAGATTNLAWHTNLRQAADKVALLRHHPLKEVRETAEAIEVSLIKSFPNSFGHKRYEATENFNKECMKDYYYHDQSCSDFRLLKNEIDESMISFEILKSRPEKTEMPRHFAEAGNLQFEFLLDFGSFRDIQRHRAVTQRMPLLTTEIGFEEWYINELPEEVQIKAKRLLKSQEELIEKLNLSKEEKQYYMAMGYKISNRLTCNLPAIVYLVELRATRFVHQTLRTKAKMMAQSLEELFGSKGLILHLDKEPDRFDIKRGEHDITLK